MTMVAEISAMVQTVKILSDAVKANKSLRNFNEVETAVLEVNTKLSAVLTVALESQGQQATLVQRIRELEKENTELKNWNRERDRYQLTEIATGMFAYRPKPGMEASEPAHNLCANCFTKGEKAILQFQSYPDEMYRCSRCGSILHVGTGSLGFARLQRT